MPSNTISKRPKTGSSNREKPQSTSFWGRQRQLFTSQPFGTSRSTESKDKREQHLSGMMVLIAIGP